jgi:hypothetical protein
MKPQREIRAAPTIPLIKEENQLGRKPQLAIIFLDF